MKRRRSPKCALLVTVLLATCLLTVAPSAWAAPTASPSPTTGALPTVTYTVPSAESDATGVTSWNGNSVLVDYKPGKSPVDAAKSELYINDAKVPLSQSPVDMSMVGGNGIQFPIPTNFTVPIGDDTFKVVLVTKAGPRVEYTWKYKYAGPSSTAPSIINFTVMRQWWYYIAKGGIITVELTVISIAFASVFALFGALGRLSGGLGLKQAWDKYHSFAFLTATFVRKIPYWLATFYTSLFRGTPLLLQIIVIYYAIPAVILWGRARWGIFNHVPFPSAFVAGIAALSLNYGAYLTEVFRAGIQAVPKGQTEASWALGLSSWQTRRRIILPQAFKIVIPAIGNDFIALIKDTSLVSVITVPELLERAQLVGGRTANYLSPLLVAAAVYWILTIFFSFWQARLERRMEHDRARA
jgi:polar amino acid transport system permease protein